jgi:DNA-binding CsgD family transcriptional regulator
MSQRALASHVTYCREQVRRGLATCRQLAEELGVTERAVQACVYGRTYAHIPGALPSPKRKRRRQRTTPLTEAEVLQIREEYAAGVLSIEEIAEKHKISRSYVVQLGRGTARKEIPGGTLNRKPVRRVDPKQAARRGERHPNARLDALCVVGIRELARLGVEHARIADVFGTTPENVCMISRRHRWRHVPDMPLTPTALKHLPPAAVELLESVNAARAS